MRQEWFWMSENHRLWMSSSSRKPPRRSSCCRCFMETLFTMVQLCDKCGLFYSDVEPIEPSSEGHQRRGQLWLGCRFGAWNRSIWLHCDWRVHSQWVSPTGLSSPVEQLRAVMLNLTSSQMKNTTCSFAALTNSSSSFTVHAEWR